MNRLVTSVRILVIFGIGLLMVPLSKTEGQDRLKAMPGADRYQKMSKEIASSIKSGSLAVTWQDDGKGFEYRKDGTIYQFDLAEMKAREIGKVKENPKGNGPMGKGGRPGEGFRPGSGRNGQGGPMNRGRQVGSTFSPDGNWRAFFKDRNLYLSDHENTLDMPITSEGSEKSRLKFGSASWVYGEELRQRSAMWWSPDSKKIAFYRFDESPVKDYFLTLDQTGTQDRIDAEPYPKAGATNPIVDLLVYDLASRKTVKIDVRDGKPFDNSVVGHYVYDISWSPNGREILFHRTNRLQNVLELAAGDPETGKVRVILHEEWPTSWVENSPPMQFLKDKNRFLWLSERNGWRNLYLYELSGKLLAEITRHDTFEVSSIVRIDEANNTLYYMAHDGDNPLKLQLHRVSLDGTNDKRLTDPNYHHTILMAPDCGHYVDIVQSHDSPPVSRLIDRDGKILVELAKSDTSKFDQLGLKKVELLKFKAADGQTDLYGILHFPSNFDPKLKYPLLVSVYAGPSTVGARETFYTPSPLTEYGFLVASFDSRSASGRGKKFLDAIYRKLGVVEIDDQAAGVKSLWDRPYVDKKRVGMFGTSYGGTVSATCLMRYPDVFQAASSSSPVTDYRLYDSIYTERYMGLPEDNKAGYDAASIMNHVNHLKGRLLLYYGTADNNVHPSNSLQLIRALQQAGKSIEVQVGPDLGHSGVNQQRMMEFFIENLVLHGDTNQK